MATLTGQPINTTYAKLIQIDTGSLVIADGYGNIITNLPTTASWAISASWAPGSPSVSASYATFAETASLLLGSVANAISASYAATASLLLGTVVSASYAISASYAPSSGTGSVGSSVGSDIFLWQNYR